jgi:hypothetical protein
MDSGSSTAQLQQGQQWQYIALGLCWFRPTPTWSTWSQCWSCGSRLQQHLPGQQQQWQQWLYNAAAGPLEAHVWLAGREFKVAMLGWGGGVQ